MEDRVRIMDVNGMGVVLEDLTAMGPGEEFEACLQMATEIIHGQDKNSVRTILDVTGAHFNTEVSQKIKAFAKDNNPYVCATGVVGLTPLMHIFFNSVAKLTNRKMEAFRDRETALAWVIAHETRA